MSRRHRSTGRPLRSGLLRIAIILAYSACPGFGQSAPAPADSVEDSTAPTSAPSTSDDANSLQDIDLFSLEVPTVVTASRREQEVRTLPYAVSVITAEDIRKSGARNVPDALRLVPGVDVAELSANNYAVSVRGFHDLVARNVLVMVDGRQIFDSLFGGTLWGNWPLKLEDIERIEVIRGPGGVTWGANAVNGVINIISKDPKDQLGLTTTAGGGSRGTHREYTGYAFQEGKLRMRVSGDYQASDGNLRGGSFFRRPDDDLKAAEANMKAIYDAGPYDTLTLAGGSKVVDGSFPVTPLGSLTTQRNGGSQANYLQSQWQHRVASDNTVSLNAFVNDFYGSPSLKAVDYRYQQLGLQFNHTFDPWENHTFSWGIDGRTDLLDTTNSDPYLLTRDFVSTAIVGFYAQDDWRFAPRWTFSLGGRLDYEFYGGFEPSGRASLSYDLSDTSAVYGAVSRAFQMPAVGSRFLNAPFTEGLFYYTSDQDLQSEQLIAYELGHRATFFERLSTDLSLYCHDYDNLTILKPELGPPGLVRYNFQNGYQATTFGLEADAKYALTERLTLLGNYTFEKMSTDGRYSLANTEAMTLPKHKFMLGTRYNPIDRLNLSAHLFFVDDTNGPNPLLPFRRMQFAEYFRLDLRAEYEFWKDRGTVAVGVRNLLDSHHPEGTSLFLNNTEVPRMIYAEMRLNFR